MDTSNLSPLGVMLSNPDWSTVLLLAAFYGGVAVLLNWFSFGRPFARFAEGYRGVAPPYLTNPATLFALMAAFLGNTIVLTDRQAEQAVLQEADRTAAIVGLADLVPGAHDLHRMTAAYIRTAIDHEWHLPRDFAPGDTALRALTEAVLKLPAEPAGASAQLLGDVRGLASARAARRGIVESRVDEIPWLSVLLLGVLTQFGVAVVHLDKRKPQIAALAITTASLVVVLGLLALIERPFDGAHAVSPAPLLRVLAG